MTEPRRAPVETLSDSDLVARVLKRDAGAARALMQRYNRRLYRVARGVIGNDTETEDVLQEAYMRAFGALATFRGDSSLSTWLTRIVLNEAFQRLRRRTELPLSQMHDGGQPAGAEVIPFPLTQHSIDPERSMAQKQLCQLVERAIDALPQEFRSVLIARVIEGMSVEETATAFELNPDTVRTRLHRARRLLKDALAEHVGPELSGVFPFDGKRCERITEAVVARLGFEPGNV